MARSVNRVILIGNCGKDPEVKYAANGNAVAKFSMATGERFKNKSSGEWEEKTEWHSLVAFQKLAEVIKEYISKGSKLYIEGRLQTSSWDDSKTGEKKYRTEIVVSELIMLGDKSGSTQSAPDRTHETPVDDSDIPF